MDRTISHPDRFGNDEPAAGHVTRHRLFSHTFSVNWTLLVVIIGALLLVAPVWGPGFPWATDGDMWGHLQSAASVGSKIREAGLIEGFKQGGWMQEWYLGDPGYVYYPPLTTWILGPLAALFGDIFLVYRLIITGYFLILGLSIYMIGRRWGRDSFLAALGALLAISTPFTLRTVFVEGSLSRALAILVLPWLLYFTEQLLSERRIAWDFLLVSILWTTAILFHSMQAAIFAIAITIYATTRVVTNIFVPLRRIAIVLLPIICGAGLAAMYILPAYSHSELSQVPFLAAEKVNIYTITLDALLPYHSNIESASLGIALFVLATLIVVRARQDRQTALWITSLACIVLAFGPVGGVYQLLPLNQSFYPQRFLNVACVFLPLIVATSTRGVWKRRWWIAAFVVVLLIDAYPVLRVIQMRPAPADEQNVAIALAEQPPTGRVAPLSFPNATSSEIYLTSVVGHKDNISGWTSIETAVNNLALRRLLSAVDKSPDYLNRILALWNTDYIVGQFTNSPAGIDSASLRSRLGFQPVSQSGTLELWRRSTPSAFFQQLIDNRMLILGDNPTDWLLAFPYASEGSDPNPKAYDAGYLAHYSVIGASRIPPNADFEASLSGWVRDGHTLILDLSSANQLFDPTFSLFGVRSNSVALSGTDPIRWPAALSTLPATVNFSFTGQTWVGASYQNLDQVVAEVVDPTQKVTYPILGYKNVGKGRVWFVGFNLFYLLDQLDQREAIHTLSDYLTADTGVNRDLTLPAFPAQVVSRKATHLQFSYSAASQSSVVLSMTYFPRWHATLDDTPLDVKNHENLVLLDLPSGSHSVTLTFDPLGTPAANTGWLVTIASLVFLCGGVVILNRRSPVALADREITFEDRVPQKVNVEREEEIQYATCPNCRFRLAQEGLPSELSYPFNSMECPLCGFKLSNTILAGEKLSDFSRRRLAIRWLKSQNLGQGQLMRKFGLRMQDIFEDSPEAVEVLEKGDPADTAEKSEQQNIFSVAFSPDQHTIASGGVSGNSANIQLWRTDTGQETGILAGHTGEITSLVYSPNGAILASASRDLTIRLWWVNSGNEVAVLRGHLGWAADLVFNGNGTLLASAGRDRSVRLWSVRAGKQVQVLRGHLDWVTGLAFDPGSVTLASCSADMTIRLWNLDTGKILHALTGHQSDVLAVTFSLDGAVLSSISSDGMLCRWHAARGEKLATLQTPFSAIKSASFSPDGRIMAVTDGSTIELLQIDTAEELAVLKETNTVIEKIVYNPNGKSLASVAFDGSIRLWEIQ